VAALGSGPAVAALCRRGGFVYWRVHSAVAQVPTDSPLMGEPLLMSVLDTNCRKFVCPLHGEGIPGSPGSACGAEVDNRVKKQSGERNVILFGATPLCAAVPLHGLGYTGSGSAFFVFREKWGGGFPGRDDHQNHIFGVNLAKQMRIGALFPRAWALIDIRE